MGERADKGWLRVAEVADLLGVSANTVRRWTDGGRLAGYRSPGGHRRYRANDVLALLPAGMIQGAQPPHHAAQLQGESDELQAVVQAGLDLTRIMTETPKELPRELARRLCMLTGAARCDVYALDDGELQLIAAMEGDQSETSRTGGTWPADDWSPVSLNAVTPVAATFAIGDDLDARVRLALRRRGCRSLAWAPMCTGTRVIGAVEVSDVRRLDFSPHLPVIASFANLCAHGLGLESIYEQLARRERAMQELIDLSHEIAATHDIEGFVLDLAHRLMTAVQADDVDVWRVKDGRVTCLVSLDREGADASLAGTVMDLEKYPGTAAAMERLEPFVIANLRDPALTAPEVEEYRRWGFVSSLTMPLVAGGRLVGIVDMYDDAERDWAVHIPFLTGVLQPVAGLFDNAVLLREVEQHGRFQQQLVELSTRLSRAGSLEDVAREAATGLRSMTGCEDCDVWWQEEGYLRCLASVDENGLDEEVRGKTLDLAHFPSTAEALERREPLVFTSLDDPRVTDFEREDWSAYGFSSLFSLPLVVGDETLGMIDLFDTRERDFEDVREFVVSAGGAIAAALKSSFLVQDLRQTNTALRELVELSDQMNEAADLAELARMVAERLRAILQAEDCDIWRIDDGRMHCLASIDSRGWDADEVGTERDLAEYGDTVAALAANEPIVIGDLDAADLPASERAAYRHWNFRSMVSLPLVADGRPLGLIDVFDTRVRDYAKLLDFIRNVGRLLAGAFEKALLLDRLAIGNSELQTLNEIAQRTAASLDLDEIVEAAVDELRQLLGFDGYGLVLADGEHTGRVISSLPGAEELVGTAAAELSAAFGARLVERRTLVLQLPEDAPLPPDHPLIAGMASAAIIALPSDAGVLGSLSLLSREPDAFQGADLDLLERVATQLSLAIRNGELYDEIKQMHLGNLKALSSALNAKDYYTLGHAARVATYTVMLGRRLGWGEDLLASLEEAAYLHDIGKISISDRVLLKPGRLNQQEWQQMCQHPVFSADIIRPLFPEALVQAVRHHHERFDGKGYPDGLAGEEIPLLARAMSVVDSYDAMSCRRPYKAALSYEESLAELERCRGTQFDPQMVDAFRFVLDDLAGRRAEAERIAAEAAARIPGELHRRLGSREDEGTAEYEAVAEILREVRDANPPTRFLTTHLRLEKKYVIGVDPEEDPKAHSHFGDEIFADDELPVVLAGGRSSSNTLYADEFGVWVNGLAPVLDARGGVAAVVSADLPALGRGDEAHASDSRQTFASLLQSAAVRLGGVEIDSITDALTGLYNHRYLHERLSEELRLARETGKPLTVLFCDLDNFKRYNAVNGHSAGDGVLREIAHIIEQAVRSMDVAARYGGEEFVVLLVETGADAALVVAERIRERIRAAGFEAETQRLTVSIGSATWPEDGERREELLERAAAAMGAAKRLGRDRVVAADEVLDASLVAD